MVRSRFGPHTLTGLGVCGHGGPGPNLNIKKASWTYYAKFILIITRFDGPILLQVPLTFTLFNLTKYIAKKVKHC